MTDTPFFSVVIATYGRGRHITPTLESALAQTFRDFELIVVGDGCNDDTEAAVRSVDSGRVRWLNLDGHIGSQSTPNNFGIAMSRGHFIAYLGHDDIWAPDHLEQLHAQALRGDNDIIVSGCVYHGPPESGVAYVTGLFDASEAALEHFFPPTSLAHRRDVTARIGFWVNPMLARAPVDSEFLLRAAHAGLTFVSTGRITAHKFAAGHRYLSYLRVSSDEQRAMLRRLNAHDDTSLAAIVEAAKRQGRYMSMRYQDFSRYRPGQLFEQNRKNKGISRPKLRALAGRAVIEQGAEERGLDWHGGEPRNEGGWLCWSGPNPWPKILIPFTGRQAKVAIEVGHARPDGRLAEILVEGRRVAVRTETVDGGTWLAADIVLSPSDYTILTLDAPTFRPVDFGLNDDGRSLGLSVGRIVVVPAGQSAS
jgi:glycosyltransferase involved in cell wall biosynthesis